ncbi:MAG: hypothetical protein ACYTDW_22335 [Planctomycetota bacterium]
MIRKLAIVLAVAMIGILAWHVVGPGDAVSIQVNGRELTGHPVLRGDSPGLCLCRRGPAAPGRFCPGRVDSCGRGLPFLASDSDPAISALAVLCTRTATEATATARVTTAPLPSRARFGCGCREIRFTLGEIWNYPAIRLPI